MVSIKKEEFMDPKDKQRISIYIDRELVKQADATMPLSGCESRNEFVARAIERYIAELILGRDNPFISEALTESVAKACQENMGKVSNGLFRYAVYVDLMARMFGDYFRISPRQFEEYQRQAYNNVRRTRGKVPLDETIKHSNIEEEE